MKFIEFAQILGKLKRIKRAGWVREKIKNPESVAEHSFRHAVLALVLADKIGVDVDKSVKMALIHDIGEAEIGDIVVYRAGNALPNLEEKNRLEREAINKIFTLIDKKELVDLFDEYMEQKTKVAIFVKQLDKLEMALQALDYENEHKVNLEEFFVDTKINLKDGYLIELLNKLEDLRNK